jgi:hypothetical protein
MDKPLEDSKTKGAKAPPTKEVKDGKKKSPRDAPKVRLLQHISLVLSDLSISIVERWSDGRATLSVIPTRAALSEGANGSFAKGQPHSTSQACGRARHT